MSRRRFFVPSFTEASATLSGEQAYHLGRVLRARAGQLYELSDGNQVWLGRVASVEADAVRFELVEQIAAAQSSLEIVLLIAIVKFDRFEWLLEKATELGVTEIVPVAARRSQPGLLAAAPKRRARWEKILLESAQQSRRLRSPTLEAPVSFSRAVASLQADLKILLSESADAPPIKTVLRWATNAQGSPRVSRRAALSVGPEGGWTESELRIARDHNFREASLGPNILRAETAVIAALAAINYELG